MTCFPSSLTGLVPHISHTEPVILALNLNCGSVVVLEDEETLNPSTHKEKITAIKQQISIFTLFLLRNHSQNMKQSIKGDSVVFEELFTTEILGAINGNTTDAQLRNFDFPVKAKFGRFNPFPYSTGSPSFMTYA